MTFLRSVWVVTAELYRTVMSGNLTALRKGWNMSDCATEGCDQLAQLTIQRPAFEWTIREDQIIKLNEIQVAVKKGDTVTFPGEHRKVCTDCGSEMKYLGGWEILSDIDRLALVS